MKRLVLANLASPANPGDFAILMGSLKLLRSYYGDSEITLVTRHFSERKAYESLGCRVVPSYPNVEHIATSSKIKKFLNIPKALLAKNEAALAIQRSDALFLIGGGYFYSYRRSAPGLSFLSYCLPVDAAARYGKPVILLSQSYGPLNSMPSRFLFKRVVKQSGLVFFRELISEAWLKESYPEDSKRFHFMPDLAFFLEPPDLQLPEENIRGPGGPRLVGVTVRPWREGVSDHTGYLSVLSNTLAWLHQQHQFKVRIIVQVIRPTEGESDEQVSRSLYRQLQERIGPANVELVIQKPYFPLPALCRAYKECDFLIGMRLHSAILSFLMGRPAIVVGYQHKAQGVVTALGLEKLFVDSFERISEEQMKHACLRVVSGLPELCFEVEQAVQRTRAEIAEIFQKNMESLGL